MITRVPLPPKLLHAISQASVILIVCVYGTLVEMAPGETQCMPTDGKASGALAHMIGNGSKFSAVTNGAVGAGRDKGQR